VAVEVRFSPPYEDPVHDVCAWLQRSQQLSVAILVNNIEEDSHVSVVRGIPNRASMLLSRCRNSLAWDAAKTVFTWRSVLDRYGLDQHPATSSPIIVQDSYTALLK
jgi:hypothetical protein